VARLDSALSTPGRTLEFHFTATSTRHLDSHLGKFRCAQLHRWIDITFGCALLGADAVAAKNVPFDDGSFLHTRSFPLQARPGTLLETIRNTPLLGPYSRTVSRALWWP